MVALASFNATDAVDAGNVGTEVCKMYIPCWAYSQREIYRNRVHHMRHWAEYDNDRHGNGDTKSVRLSEDLAKVGSKEWANFGTVNESAYSTEEHDTQHMRTIIAALVFLLLGHTAGPFKS